MSLKYIEKGEVKDFIIHAPEIQVIDMQDKFRKKDLENVIKEVAKGEHIFVGDKEPEDDGVWIDTSDIIDNSENNNVIERIKSYTNGKVGDLTQLSTKDKSNIVNSINENTTQLSDMGKNITNLQNNKQDKIADSGWLDFSSTINSDLKGTTKVRKIGNEVFLDLTFIGMVNENSTMAQLPSGYYPDTASYIYGRQIGYIVTLYISTSGAIILDKVNTGTLSSTALIKAKTNFLIN